MISEYEVVAFPADDEFVESDVFNGLPLTPFSDLLEQYPPRHFLVHRDRGAEQKPKIWRQFLSDSVADGLINEFFEIFKCRGNV